jgi:hypothetical protein
MRAREAVSRMKSSNLIADFLIGSMGEQLFDTFEIPTFHSSEERSVALPPGGTVRGAQEEMRKRRFTSSSFSFRSSG